MKEYQSKSTIWATEYQGCFDHALNVSRSFPHNFCIIGEALVQFDPPRIVNAGDFIVEDHGAILSMKPEAFTARYELPVLPVAEKYKKTISTQVFMLVGMLHNHIVRMRRKKHQPGFTPGEISLIKAELHCYKELLSVAEALIYP